TSLLLHAMGAEVVAIEEVRKYIDSLLYLKEAFGLDRLTTRPLSLYDCTTDEFQDAFDVVLYAGVIYHVTDPVLSLRIAFNCLKDGGVCLVETAANTSNRPVLDYEGPTQFFNAHDPNVKQSGWNWFIPSVPALTQMMGDVGFTDIQATPAVNTRAAAVGWRRQHVDILRGGLSVRTVR
ncbi:MAG: DUF1698 domain-containing protein, partial [Anaerolineae bacterium]|nr:DUF1698 domain-containing protein [Anaerolineae bacterium]